MKAVKTSVFSARVNAKDSKAVEDLARIEGEDKSAILRKLMHLGIEAYRREAAVRAYSQGKASLNRASQLMGTTLWEFLAELGKQGVKLNYGLEEFEGDLKTVERFAR